MENPTAQKQLAALVLFVQLISPPLIGASMATPNPADAVVGGHNSFAVDLYQALGQDDGNLFFSPLSISTALSMTYAGARNQTAAEMQKVLHLPADPNAVHEGNMVLQELLEKSLTGSGQLKLANSLWPDRGESLLDSFVQSLEKYYGAECRALDFRSQPKQAMIAINKWVEDKTKGRIVDLLQPGDITSVTRLVLANAIVFDGKWVQAFDPEKTRPMSFHLADGHMVQVPGMVQKADFKFGEMSGFKVLEMPFAGGATSLLIALPDEDTDLAELEKKLSPASINEWLSKMRKMELTLTLPRFKMEERLDLSRVLTGMGLENAFSPNADFTGMSADKGLYIDKVIHQATLKIHEEGAEAAAATAVLMKRSSITPSFRVDRPFLFMIRDGSTGSILFMGRMMNPEV